MGNITGQIELLIHWRFNPAVKIRESDEKPAPPKAGFMGTLKRMFHMSAEDEANLDIGDDVRLLWMLLLTTTAAFAGYISYC